MVGIYREMGFNLFASDVGALGEKNKKTNNRPIHHGVPNIFISSFLAIWHHYVRGGVERDLKRVDDKMLLFDFLFFQQLTEPDFIRQYKEKLDFFVQQLNTENEKGTTPS